MLRVVPGAFLRAREKEPPIPGDTELWEGPVHLASGSSARGRREKPKNEPEGALEGAWRCMALLSQVASILRNKPTEKPFPSKEACEWATGEEQGRRVSLAESRGLTETVKDQGLERGSRRREPGTQHNPRLGSEHRGH